MLGERALRSGPTGVLPRHSPLALTLKIRAGDHELLQADAVVQLHQGGPHLAELPIAPNHVRGVESDGRDVERGSAAAIPRCGRRAGDCPTRAPCSPASPAASSTNLEPFELEIPRLPISAARQHMRADHVGSAYADAPYRLARVKSTRDVVKRQSEVIDLTHIESGAYAKSCPAVWHSCPAW